MGNILGSERTQVALKEQKEALIYGVKEYDPKKTQSFEEQLPETSAIKGLDNKELAAMLENLLKEADTYEKAKKYIPEGISFANEASFDTRVSAAQKAFSRSAGTSDTSQTSTSIQPPPSSEASIAVAPSVSGAMTAPISSPEPSVKPSSGSTETPNETNQTPSVTEPGTESDKPWYKKYGKELAYGGAAITALAAVVRGQGDARQG